MQVLIDIPSEWITDLENGCFGAKHNAYDLVGAIMNGIVLPESHGDLIDRDKLEPDCCELEIHDGDDWRNDYCGVSLMQIENYADVIIPATKENNE